MTPAILSQQARLKAWLVGAALPLWWEAAGDPRGGFYESLGMDGRPIEGPRRCFTAARQVYVYSVAPQFGWNGAAPARQALDFLLARFRKDDGLFATVVDPLSGSRANAFDLYDHAFVLFALAVASRALGAAGVETIALDVLDALQRDYRHPQGGFEEDQPRRLPLRANPHMHLFEAALEWLAANPADPAPWSQLADELAELCLKAFIDPTTGALHEFFDAQWRFAVGDLGQIVEPGHQFEWAWLLARWSRLRSRPDALAAARRMAEVGESRGVHRGLAINELWSDLTVKDGGALLWPQTERIKAWVILSELAESDAERAFCLARVDDAATGLWRYLQTGLPGLWFKAIDARGETSGDPAPTRYLYHIVCAIQELHRLT
jgi:mannose/cellobiose epimerase-like protein (N-acyl-D-glucosamine 2-epimerase family)